MITENRRLFVWSPTPSYGEAAIGKPSTYYVVEAATQDHALFLIRSQCFTADPDAAQMLNRAILLDLHEVNYYLRDHVELKTSTTKNTRRE